MNERDRLIDRVASELRRPVEVDGEAKSRLMDEVRAKRHRGRFAQLARALSPRWHSGWRITALAAAAVVTVVAGAALLTVGSDDGGATELRSVQFVYVGGNATRVYIVGDFNDWDRWATPLRRSATGEVWSVTLRLAPGRYGYAFVIDGEHWVADEAAPQAPADEFGIANSVIVVEDAST